MIQPVKRPVRTGLRLMGGCALLAIATVILSVDGVDSRPYFREPYYAQTIGNCEPARRQTCLHMVSWRRALVPSCSLHHQCSAGSACAGTVPLAPAGRLRRPARQTGQGVHDDLHVKAVALKVQDRLGVMVGADALIIPREVADMAVGD